MFPLNVAHEVVAELLSHLYIGTKYTELGEVIGQRLTQTTGRWIDTAENAEGTEK